MMCLATACTSDIFVLDRRIAVQTLLHPCGTKLLVHYSRCHYENSCASGIAWMLETVSVAVAFWQCNQLLHAIMGFLQAVRLRLAPQTLKQNPLFALLNC